MPSSRRRMCFTATLEEGHKGAAVIVPFDPARRWGMAPVLILSPRHGKELPGHPVRGTIQGEAFTGWIGKRWGRHFLMIEADLQEAAGVVPGQEVEVAIEPVGKRVGRKSRT